ncbi:nucleotide-sugar transporter-domain-containing protein [Penicillium digitatum]|uniref:Uncharacterized protein n=3 Tax=Penicillium digitatum TaxID=36651 RepID=K9FWW8_PEND2|nr:hypothetical protein PDIP_45190 [Penicillium digitatum Pd1]EKV07198.1 hypothetical protein PDIG_74720 [Penicillium digitatum PHI26]EKV14121.1 hypothetical protein PDIP_45190 [Penicillium digitatum Pd1]KAG0159717.1 hypothetical protein PDIDSM_7241 [Penicillium digitatum]QQK46181.1 nucleotide-sugar transporter-domain-containing protein [Penicillium digitatum]
MGQRELPPVHVPLSSRKPAQHDPLSTQEQTRMADRRASKAQRFFGTDISLPTEHGGWQESPNVPRPSFVKPTDSVPRQTTGFVPFPRSSENHLMPDQNLRVRASSPLLSQDYQSQDAAPPLPKLSPKSSKKVHHTGSSSTLFSYFSSKESSKTPKNQGLQPKALHGLSVEPEVTYVQDQDPPKESKRKTRSSKIDLSVLFPKPRNPAPPTLLSPHRMVNSPSPVSTVVPDPSFNKIERMTGGTSNSASRYVDPHPPPLRSSITKNDPSKHGGENSDLPSIAESKNGEWSEQSLERTFGTSEVDLALDRYAARRSLLSHEQLQQENEGPQEPRKSSRRAHSPSRHKETHLSPVSGLDPNLSRGLSTPQESWKTNESKFKSDRSSLTKKSSKNTLKNKDLRNTSMLCLSSSSEDEDDDDLTPTSESMRNTNKFKRGSVATYDEDEPHVYTSSTAHAATAVRRFDRALSTSTRGSRQTENSLPVPVARPRKASQSSNGKSSQKTGRTTQTRRSSGVPSIPDEILAQFPQQPLRTPAELKELNRRSRVIAVTRQEQDLLEAMRIRKGKVTPSLLNAVGADRRSLASGPSLDSFCESDTSFLRLSNAFPPFDVSSEKGVTQYKDGTPSPSSGSDNERKPRTKVSSSGFSADYSESLPSPSTSGISPMTPTLPIHRFSPLPSPKPPPRGPPPAIPENRKQHTRRRTDSSEAILLDDGDELKRNNGLPLWSFDFDWNRESANIASVH